MKKIKEMTLLAVFWIGLSPYANAQVQQNRQYQLLQKAVEQYEKLRDKGSWETLALTDKTVIKVNQQSVIIPAIKQRLELLGDLKKSHSLFGARKNSSESYTANLEAAVKRFQQRHGLEDDGIIGPSVIRALNIGPDARINQLQINMDRLLEDTVQYTGLRIIANIPEYKLHVYENKNEVLSMDIVVGKATNQTVIFSDEMEHVVFSPYWNVPPNIVKNEILPAMNKNPRYLRNENMEVTGTEDGLPVIRQKPGPRNALGKVKFMFPNKYNIYFHDTPAKTLFERNQRAFSHGCIRLSQPFELARLLLKDQSRWTDDAIHQAMNAGTEKWVKLTHPVPIAISYFTAWVQSDGTVHFRDDIYGHDKDMASIQ